MLIVYLAFDCRGGLGVDGIPEEDNNEGKDENSLSRRFGNSLHCKERRGRDWECKGK